MKRSVVPSGLASLQAPRQCRKAGEKRGTRDSWPELGSSTGAGTTPSPAGWSSRSRTRGRVLGFGARRLVEDDPIKAKYVNSPESELFHKASLVYGLDRSRAAVARRTWRSS